jgi:hypothetical protein
LFWVAIFASRLTQLSIDSLLHKALHVWSGVVLEEELQVLLDLSRANLRMGASEPID